MSKKPAWLVAMMLKKAGVPCAELIAKMLSKCGKQPDTPTASMYLYGTPNETGNIGLRVGDTVTLYDGAVTAAYPTELPKNTFGLDFAYVAIIRDKDNKTVKCFYTTAPLVVKHGPDERYFVLSHGEWWYRLYWTNGEWIDPFEGLISGNPVPVSSAYGDNIFSDASYDLLWSSYDIYDEDSALQFTASDPIPVSGIVGNSYNGNVLPVLDKWDKTKHPCASLVDATTPFDPYTKYRIYLSAGYEVFQADGYCGICLDAGENGIMSYDCAVLDSGVILGGGWSSEYTGYVDGYALSNTIRDDILWTNTDIVLPDGTTYLQGTEPIPIYEVKE